MGRISSVDTCRGRCRAYIRVDLHREEIYSKMKRLLVASLFLCAFQGSFAPFTPGDPRHFLNPLIEPWWCKVPRGVRSFLLKVVEGRTRGRTELQKSQTGREGKISFLMKKVLGYFIFVTIVIKSFERNKVQSSVK